MGKSIRFRRSPFDKLPAAYRAAEHLSLAGTLQAPRPYPGIRHSYPGELPAGALRIQTQKLMFLNQVLFKTSSKNNIFAKYLSHMLAK